MSPLGKLGSAFLIVAVLFFPACRGAMDSTGNPAPGSGGSPAAADLPPTQSPVKRLIVVNMQNRSFDNLFGTFPGAEGIRPGVPGFSQRDSGGNIVTPFLITTDATTDLPHGRNFYLAAWNNGGMDRYAAVEGSLSMGHYDNTTAGVGTLWSYASQFALADHYFASVMSNEPANMLYLVRADDNNFPFSIQPAFGPCNKPDPAAHPFTNQNVGDQLTAKGITWTWYHENYGDCGNYVAVENPFQFFTSTQNSAHIQDLSAFNTALAANNLPAVVFVQPAPAHDMHPGSGPVSRSVEWLDGFIKQVQASPAWNSVAIVVLWDESGGWWDHVPPPQVDSQGYGARAPMMVISPFAKRNYISHLTMDHTSVLRFISWNWGLAPLNARAGLDANINLRDMLNF